MVEKSVLSIEYKNISEIKPYEKNPRKNDKAVDQVAKSITEYGFKNPIILDKNNIIVAGHTRLKAAEKLKLDKVPTIKADDLSPEQIKAFRIMDNRSSDFSDWDDDLLKEELSELKNMDFDLDLTGFDDYFGEDNKTEEDDFIEVSAYERAKKNCKIKKGDIYQLGEQKLLCGDATDKDDVDKLMDGQKADMVFTDPPYGVNFTKKSKNIFKNKGYCEIKNDDLNVRDISKIIWKPVFKNMYDVSVDSCSFYMTMPQGGDQMMMMMMMMDEHWKVKHELIWVKESPVFSMNRLDYDYKHEPIMYGWKKNHKFYGLGEYKNSIWEIKKGKDGNKSHPTIKPIELIANAINNSSKKGMLVLDLFGGSGSTLIACEQLNRKCYMMEIDPIYCQIIIDRWEKYTGKKAQKL